MSNPLCSCIHCKKQFSIRGIHSHYIMTHTTEGNIRAKNAAKLGSVKGSAATSLKFSLLRKEQQNEYYNNPKLCVNCNNNIPFEKRSNKFCSQSCAATFTNKQRDYSNARETWNKKKKEISPKPKKSQAKIFKPIITNNKIIIPEIEGEYTRLYSCSCKHCNTSKLYRKKQKYCNNCNHLYSHEGRAKYWFAFNVFHYPEIFDLSLITTYGFRDNKTNPNGITRDHKVSVNEAIRNNYDSYYIKHPMNCELMFFEENNKKKTNSSITYEELIKLVDEFDSKR